MGKKVDLGQKKNVVLQMVSKNETHKGIREEMMTEIREPKKSDIKLREQFQRGLISGSK